jgi:hypothetical protein
MKTHRMKKRTLLILFQLAVLVGLWGCAQHQYVTVDGKLMYDDNYGFFDSNDTLTILYTFNGLNCPINIELHNNHTKPIYVDWSRSFVVIDGRAYSYWIDDPRVNTVVETYHYDYYSLTTSVSNVNSIISKVQKVNFLPPQSYSSYTPIWLMNSSINLKESKAFLDTNSLSKKRFMDKKYNFNETDSPMTFRSFLTVSFAENFSDPIYLDHSFWVSEVVETKLSLRDISGMNRNKFYLERDRRSESIFMYAAAIIAIPLMVIPYFLMIKDQTFMEGL